MDQRRLASAGVRADDPVAAGSHPLKLRSRGTAAVAGALFQEVIDLAVILNALRALRG
jgi:hypothetical protein